ncbi:MAG TPA: hypothetical protein VKV21_13710 [Solirubrobacteraceae bacterium]|nr:hypothetical protein [Solirubrobacteraceae bacterium]
MLAACGGPAVTQALHFHYHALHLERFTPAERTEQTTGLAVFLILPGLAFALGEVPD